MWCVARSWLLNDDDDVVYCLGARAQIVLRGRLVRRQLRYKCVGSDTSSASKAQCVSAAVITSSPNDRCNSYYPSAGALNPLTLTTKPRGQKGGERGKRN